MGVSCQFRSCTLDGVRGGASVLSDEWQTNGSSWAVSVDEVGAATIEVAPKGLRRGKRVAFAGNGFSGGIR